MSHPYSLLDAIGPYLAGLTTPPDEHQRRLAEVAEGMPNGGMKLSHDSAVVLTILATAIRPRFAVEIGTFVGYSSLAIAKALPPDGHLLCCDVSEEWTAIARRHWAEAGVEDRIELKIGPAADTVRSLPSEPAIDFAFVDADKGGYLTYYELLVERLSERGVIAIDNTIWSGRVADENDTSPQTTALREVNQRISSDPRTVNVTLPVGDGLTLAARVPPR